MSSVSTLFSTAKSVFEPTGVIVPHPVNPDLVLTINPDSHPGFQKATENRALNGKVQNTVLMAQLAGARSMAAKSVAAVSKQMDKANKDFPGHVAKHLFTAEHGGLELDEEFRTELVTHDATAGGDVLYVKDDGNEPYDPDSLDALENSGPIAYLSFLKSKKDELSGADEEAANDDEEGADLNKEAAQASSMSIQSYTLQFITTIAALARLGYEMKNARAEKNSEPGPSSGTGMNSLA